MNAPRKSSRASDRRQFLKQSSTALAGAALVHAINVRSYAAENNTIKIALIGCGGRGTGAAANALSTAGPVELVAMADLFPDRMKTSLTSLQSQFGDKVQVPAERQFLGMDAYKKAIAEVAQGGVALLTTPPTFRPIHFEHAVSAHCNVFMEKSFAVDAPGVRRVLRTGEEATKRGLKVAGGLMSRHYQPLEDAVEEIHNGAIGDVLTCWAYRMHGPVPYRQRRDSGSELEHQIRNYSCFTWVNGSFLLDWLIHNLDICCWVKGAWPVKAQAQGGRELRSYPDQLFDHYAAEYEFADGTKLFAQGRHIAKCWNFFGDVIQGTKGSAVLGEGIPHPKLFKGQKRDDANMIWSSKGSSAAAYQKEHDLLFNAIRTDTPHNESERCAFAAMTGILGRMAVETGQMITWNDALASNVELAPGLDEFTLNSPPPVKPDAEGAYPIGLPGVITDF